MFQEFLVDFDKAILAIIIGNNPREYIVLREIICRASWVLVNKTQVLKIGESADFPLLSELLFHEQLLFVLKNFLKLVFNLL